MPIVLMLFSFAQLSNRIGEKYLSMYHYYYIWLSLTIKPGSNWWTFVLHWSFHCNVTTSKIQNVPELKIIKFAVQHRNVPAHRIINPNPLAIQSAYLIVRNNILFTPIFYSKFLQHWKCLEQVWKWQALCLVSIKYLQTMSSLAVFCFQSKGCNWMNESKVTAELCCLRALQLNPTE